MSSSISPRARAPDTLERAPAVPIERPIREIDWRLVLLGVLLVSAVYVWWHLGRGWIPFDDGTLGESAERMLQGELPHRDFDELYTGGLARLNAAAFRLLGINLWTLRLVLFAVFLAWVPAVYYIASRFVRPLAAGGITLLAVVWSLPNYSAPMPSWYSLLCATFGIAALFRYLDVGHRRWLVLAGIVGGLSFLVKVIGLYYVAGALLFFVFYAHALSCSTAGADARQGRGYVVVVSIALLLFVAALFSLVRHQLHAPELVHFVLPGALLATLFARNEWTQPAGASSARFATLGRLVVPFLAGVALPVVLYLVPYARSGALRSFAYGVFVLPMRRFSFASMPALPLTTMLALVPLAIVAAFAYRVGRGVKRRDTLLVAAALTLLIEVAAENRELYRAVWYAARNLLPVLAVGGVVLFSRERDADRMSPLLRARALLLLSVTALCSLVQFPYSAPNYFCYVAPLIILTALALYRYTPTPGPLPLLLVAFYGAFAVFRTNGSPLQSMGVAYQPAYSMATLTLERGGIEVPQAHVEVYEALIPTLRKHARGEYTWASPDMPEIYFLSGLRNPTRSLFEFFDDSTNTNERVLRVLDTRGVTAIVLNSLPSFSAAITPEMFAELAKRYPHGRYIYPFLVRWRD